MRRLKQRDQPLGHRAGQDAVVLFLELHGVGKPSERVAQGADREIDQHPLPGGGIFVSEDTFVLLPDVDAEAHVIALGAADAAGLKLGLVEDVAGVEVGDAHPPGMLAFRQHDPAAFVEIEAYALSGRLRRQQRRRGISRLCRRRGRARSRLAAGLDGGGGSRRSPRGGRRSAAVCPVQNAVQAMLPPYKSHRNLAGSGSTFNEPCRRTDP